MKPWLAAVLVPVALLTPLLPAIAAAEIWRCGSTYSSQPCPGGQPVVTDDPRSTGEREQARESVSRDRALARELAAERREREAAWRAQGSGLMGIKPLAAEVPREARTRSRPQRETSKPAARGTSPSTARATRSTKG